MATTDDEARRMVRDGQGYENLMVHCGLPEFTARVMVFGKGAAVRWWRRQQERKAKAS